MNTYLILLRGVNVGGKSKISMSDLREHLETLGFKNVATYINSGNVIVDSEKKPDYIKMIIEKALATHFKLEVTKVLVLTPKQLQSVIDKKPKNFGDDPKKFYSDAIFMIDITSKEAMSVFDPREGVDKIWEGHGVIYSQRLGSERTKSRLNKIIGTPLYKSMTIRSWSTTTKLFHLLKDRENKKN